MKRQISLDELKKINKQLVQANEDAIRLAKLMTWRIDFDLVPEGNHFFANDLLKETFGIEANKQGLLNLGDLANTAYPDKEGKESIERMFELYQSCLSNNLQKYSLVAKHINLKTNKVSYIEHNAKVEARYADGSLRIINGYNIDITKRVLLEKHNDYLINHDQMSGLKNRYAFEKHISSLDNTKPFSIVLIDIDGLKFLNDAFGHLTGDKAIVFVAETIKQVCVESIDAFRIGGDEFAIITSITDEAIINKKLKELQNIIENEKQINGTSLSISSGYEIQDGTKSFQKMFVEAENAMYRQKLSNRKCRKNKSLDMVMETLNQKTEETYDHCNRMQENAVKLMKEVGFTRQKDFEDMKIICKIHDIGKITIPLEILNKPSFLSKNELDIVKTHAEAGYKITKSIVDSDRIALAVLFHHEKIDGTGYPFNLKGEDIPPFARILAIVDSYDAMTFKTYSDKLSKESAIKELQNNSGTQFDKNYVDLFINILRNE